MADDATTEKVNLFVVGCAKSGTTAIWDFLEKNESVLCSKIKEPHFFSDIVPDKRGGVYIQNITDLASYEKCFKADSRYKYKLDASTSYCLKRSTLEKVLKYNASSKVIMIIRNPIDRAYSHYLNDISEGYRSGTFKALIEQELKEASPEWSRGPIYLELGLYAKRIEWCREIFKDRFLLLLYDDLLIDRRAVVSALSDFLELELDDCLPVSNSYKKQRGIFRYLISNVYLYSLLKALLPDSLKKALKKMAFVKSEKPEMSSIDYDFLRNFYMEDVKAVEECLGRKLPWLL